MWAQLYYIFPFKTLMMKFVKVFFWKDEVLIICSHTKEITRPNGMLSGEYQLRAPISVVLDDTYCRDDPMTVNNFLQGTVEFTSSHFSNTFGYRQYH